MYTKKIIAFVLSALMLLGLLAGCGTTAPETPETTEAVQGSSPVGILLVSMGAEFQIGYDAEGFALNVSGTNDDGRTAAATVTNFMGRDCVHAVRSLLDIVVEQKLSGNAKNLVLRLGMESEVPYEGFLENIGGDVQLKCDELGSGMMVKLIKDTDLTPEGFINVATAKELAANRAGLADTAALVGADTVENGVYTFTFGDEGEEDTATVDASTGHVALSSDATEEEGQTEEEVIEGDPVETTEAQEIVESLPLEVEEELEEEVQDN